MTGTDGPWRARSGAADTGLDVDILRREGVWPDGDVADALLIRALRTAFAAAATSGPCEVALALTDDREIRSLNRQWRGRDAATNVLSFPLDVPSPPRGHPRPLGDIVLARETVAREAEEKGISVADHAVHLAVHGLLHILGYDHGNDAEAERMERLETRILAALGIADPHAAEEPLAAGAR